MIKAYLDSAATTSVAPEVLEVILPFYQDNFGNPSSTHAAGRKVKGAIEKARKSIAQHLGAKPQEIVFLSGGTEADNMAINCSIKDLGVKRVISSKIEHHAVCDTVSNTCGDTIQIDWVKHNPEDGSLDYEHLEELLKQDIPTLVSLMHANNEIGTVLDIEKVGDLCEKYKAYFHSDTVQSVAHFPINLEQLKVDYITGAAHKFHGPKGVGFLYVNSKLNIKPTIIGGSQERDKRAGTENVAGIVAMAKAMDMAYADLEKDSNYIRGLKNYFREKLLALIPFVAFNGDQSEDSLYTVLNVNFPKHEKGDMLLFTLDIEGVCCSGGSACSSGSNKGSHVLAELNLKHQGPNVRFSFSRYTTKEEIDFALSVLEKFYVKEVA
jgi:cysteine desulfurase